MSSAQDLKQDILRKRNCGVCHFDFRIRSDLSATFEDSLKNYVKLLRFQPKSDNWYVDVGRDHAIHILAKILREDLAYGHEVMDSDDSQLLARRFVDLSGLDARFFSNSSWKSPGPLKKGEISLGSWTALTPATFDSGVVAISKESQICFWVEDED